MEQAGFKTIITIVYDTFLVYVDGVIHQLKKLAGPILYLKKLHGLHLFGFVCAVGHHHLAPRVRMDDRHVPFKIAMAGVSNIFRQALFGPSP